MSDRCWLAGTQEKRQLEHDTTIGTASVCTAYG
jgi:hypothetical protein